jgi:hypothetical protein
MKKAQHEKNIHLCSLFLYDTVKQWN